MSALPLKADIAEHYSLCHGNLCRPYVNKVVGGVFLSFPTHDHSLAMISTNAGKHLRANMHNGGRSCNSRNRLPPLPRHRSTHAGVHDD
jgi:hypothetical protein